MKTRRKSYRYCTVKIDEVYDKVPLKDGVWEHKTIMYCAEIKYPEGSAIAFCKKTKNQLVKHIKEYL